MKSVVARTSGRRVCAAVGVVGLAWIAGSALAPAAVAQSSAAAVTYPLRIVATYTVEATPDADCNGLEIATPTKGEAEIHLEGSSGVQTLSGDYSETDCANLVAEPGAIRLEEGSFIVSTEEGDELTATYEGRGGLPSLQRNVYLSGTFSITGGSGFFAGATGCGIFTATGKLGESQTNNTATTFVGVVWISRTGDVVPSRPAGTCLD